LQARPFYIKFAEDTARLVLGMNLLKQWKPSYDASYAMQASLVASGVFGLIAARITFHWRWVLGVVFILAPTVPITLLGIMPTNHQLKAIAENDAGPSSRALLQTWGRLHAVRTTPGIAETLIFLCVAVLSAHVGRT